MAEIALQQLLDRAGKSLWRVSKNTGIRIDRLQQYRANTAKMLSLDDVEPLCRELDCEPKDLLVLKNGTNGNGKAKRNGKRKASKPL